MRLLHAGVDITVIALWLGHENITTTQIYLQADMACDEDAYRILNTAGQAVSSVDDQAHRVLGRAG